MLFVRFFLLLLFFLPLWLRSRLRLRLNPWLRLRLRLRPDLRLRPLLLLALLLLALLLNLLVSLLLLHLYLALALLLSLLLLLHLLLAQTLLITLRLWLWRLAWSCATLQSLAFQFLLSPLLRRQAPGAWWLGYGAGLCGPRSAGRGGSPSGGSAGRASARMDFTRFGLRRWLCPWLHITRPGNGRFVTRRRRGSRLYMPWLTRNNGLSTTRSGLRAGLEPPRLRRATGLHLSRLTGNSGLHLAGPGLESGLMLPRLGCRGWPEWGRWRRGKPPLRRQALDLPFHVRGQGHGGSAGQRRSRYPVAWGHRDGLEPRELGINPGHRPGRRQDIGFIEICLGHPDIVHRHGSR